MGSQGSILDRARRVVADYCEEPITKILAQTRLDDLGLDSLGVVELSIRIEDEFNIVVPTRELGDWKTVGDAVRYIDRALKEHKEVRKEF